MILTNTTVILTPLMDMVIYYVMQMPVEPADIKKTGRPCARRCGSLRTHAYVQIVYALAKRAALIWNSSNTVPKAKRMVSVISHCCPNAPSGPSMPRVIRRDKA